MDRVTGSGSWAVFTAYNLLPGTAYHLMIPGTAFRDEDNNYLEASNGWNDYTVCVTGWSDVCREPFPHISSFTPSQAGDGDEVTIKGSFYSVLNVTFGGVTAASFSVVDIHTIKAVVGSGATGAVNVSGADGSGSLVGFTFMVPTAVEKELLPSLIDVSPNPSDGRKINFAFSSCAGRDQAVVTLIDMTGRIISSSTLECSPSVTWNFNPSGPITPGIYLISIQSQKDKIFKRVIVK